MKLALAYVPAVLSVVLATPRAAIDKWTSPAGCTGNLNGKFEITVAKGGDKSRSIQEKKAACSTKDAVVVTLRDGHIIDAKGRIGYIASDYQFQFDAPAQFGALVTGGFSICEGNILALGPSKTFFQCRSGNFYNLYDRTWAPHCEPASLVAVPCESDNNEPHKAESQSVETTAVETGRVSILSDGQPQVVASTGSISTQSTCTSEAVSEQTDGQVQAAPLSTTPFSTTAEVFSALTTLQTPSETIETAVPLPSSEMTNKVTIATINISTAALSSSMPEETPSTTVAESSSSPSVLMSSAPATSTTKPPTGGSSHVVGGSMGALVIGMLAAFLCL